MNHLNFLGLRRLSIVLVAILLCVASQPSFAGRRVIEKIIAVVSGEIVLLSELEQRFQAVRAQMMQRSIDKSSKSKRLKAARCQVYNKIIDDKILDAQARSLQIDASDKQVDLAMADTRRRYQLSEVQFRMALKQQGYSTVTYRAMVRRELRKLALLRRELGQKIQLSEDDARSFYKKMISGEKAGPLEVRVRYLIIEIADKSTSEQIKAKEEKAKKLLAEVLKSPAKFEELAKKHSEDAMKEKGGDLGFNKLEDYPAEWKDALLKLKTGQVHSALIKAGTKKIYILKSEGRRDSGILSFKEALPQIQKQLYQKAYMKAHKKYIAQLKKKSVIERRFTCE